MPISTSSLTEVLPGSYAAGRGRGCLPGGRRLHLVPGSPLFDRMPCRWARACLHGDHSPSKEFFFCDPAGEPSSAPARSDISRRPGRYPKCSPRAMSSVSSCGERSSFSTRPCRGASARRCGGGDRNIDRLQTPAFLLLEPRVVRRWRHSASHPPPDQPRPSPPGQRSRPAPSTPPFVVGALMSSGSQPVTLRPSPARRAGLALPHLHLEAPRCDRIRAASRRGRALTAI